jgi:dUTP pyrophosphatase
MNEIFFKSLENGEGLYQIKKATKGSAGFDLLAAIKNEISIDPGSTKLIPCGFSIQMPDGIEGQVRPRSGIALKNSVTVLNSPGTIDSDYRGEIAVILINHGKSIFSINRGMRIAQLVFINLPTVKLVESNSLDSTERGSGGFGSTGV